MAFGDEDAAEYDWDVEIDLIPDFTEDFISIKTRREDIMMNTLTEITPTFTRSAPFLHQELRYVLGLQRLYFQMW